MIARPLAALTLAPSAPIAMSHGDGSRSLCRRRRRRESGGRR
jgi:hypothetical protein